MTNNIAFLKLIQSDISVVGKIDVIFKRKCINCKNLKTCKSKTIRKHMKSNSKS